MSIQLYWREPCTTTAFNNASPAPPQCLLGSDDHLQLPGILDDLFGQLRGGDGGIFWLLLLAGKAVVVVEAQDPPSLQKGRDDRWVDSHIGSLPTPENQHLSMWTTGSLSLPTVLYPHNSRQVTSPLCASVSPRLRPGP